MLRVICVIKFELYIDKYSIQFKCRTKLITCFSFIHLKFRFVWIKNLWEDFLMKLKYYQESVRFIFQVNFFFFKNNQINLLKIVRSTGYMICPSHTQKKPNDSNLIVYFIRKIFLLRSSPIRKLMIN